MAKEQKASSGEVGIASKMAQARERMTAEVKVLGETIQREIVEAREWPPPPEVAADIKKRAFALGARSVKLLEAVDKLETLRSRLEDENSELSDQIHDLRMKSSGISPAELAHLQMENKVLKEHVMQLEEAIAGGSDTGALEAENARLQAQLKELEGEVDRMLKESAAAHEMTEENSTLRKTAESLQAEVEALKAGGARKAAPGSSFLASVWDSTESQDGGEQDPRVVSLLARIEDLEADNQEMMEKARKKLESASRARDQLANKVAELAESAALRAEQAIQEINDLREERARLEKDLEAARSGAESSLSASPDHLVGSLKLEIESLRQELDNARCGENEMISELRAEVMRLQEANAELSRVPPPPPEPDMTADGPPPDAQSPLQAEEKERLESQVSELETKIEELERENRTLTEAAQATEATPPVAETGTPGDSAGLEERINLLERELTGARSAVATAAEESDHLREEVKNLFQEWVRVEGVARELRVEKESLEARTQSLQDELEGIKAGVVAPAGDASISSDDMQKVVKTLERYIGELEDELDKKDSELEEMKGRLQQED